MTQPPPPFNLSDADNDWHAYVEALYRIFLDEIVHRTILGSGL